MALGKPYKSIYRKNSTLDFEDEFGTDPLLRRYGASPTITRSYEAKAELAAAKRLNAEADLAKAQAEEEAKIAPLKAVSERYKALYDLSSQKSKLEEDARVRSAATSVNDLLPKINSVTDLDNLVASNPDVVMDERVKLRVDATRLKLRERDKAELRSRLPKTMSDDDVNNMELWAGERQLLGDSEVQTMFRTWRDVAGRKGAAVAGLEELGVQAMPVTRSGEFDLNRAERITKELGATDTRQLVSVAGNLQRQLGDIIDQESPQALEIKGQLDSVNREIANTIDRRGQQSAGARLDAQSLGASPMAWADDLIDGNAPKKEPTPGQLAAPTPGQPSPKPIEKPRVDSRVSKAEQEAENEREETGLASQPWGVRQINEAFSSDNEEVRRKADKAAVAKDKLDPFTERDARDAQVIQKALRTVYPEIGEESNRFDVGNTNDPEVVLAAEFLQRIDPNLLKMVAASPGPGGRRGNLTFEELPEIAKNAQTIRRNTRVGAPRGSRE